MLALLLARASQLMEVSDGFLMCLRSGSAPACGLLSWSLPDPWVFACPCCVIPRPGLHSRIGGGSMDSLPMKKRRRRLDEGPAS